MMVLISATLMSLQAFAAEKAAPDAAAKKDMEQQTQKSQDAASKPVATQETQASAQPGMVVVETKKQSVFKGLLYEVWSRLRALSPKMGDSTAKHVVATAGIRGAETTTSLIQTYWKDDRTQDPEYIKELTEYTHAQQIAENGDLPGAIKALNHFVDTYTKSELKPDAQFALGITYAGAGNKEASISTLEEFVKQHPKHPLVADARQVISQFK
jgi:TolA-binding protein